MAVLRSVSYVAEVVLLVFDPELWMYVCVCEYMCFRLGGSCVLGSCDFKKLEIYGA